MIVHKNMKLAKVDPIVAHISLIFMVVYFDQLFCGVSVLSKTKGKEEKKNTKKAVWESEWVGMRIQKENGQWVFITKMSQMTLPKAVWSIIKMGKGQVR